MELPKRYDPKESEIKWQKFWEEKGIYKFDPNSDKEIYSIDTPPPTVSGKMHMGHAFSYAQQDFIVRYQRMKGKNIFYPFGTDDNGLATERLIEKMKKIKSTKMDRKEFVKVCLETLKEIRPQYIQDWKNIGMSCEWDKFYTTINEHCQKISQKSFLDIHKMDRLYQKDAPTIWCPECQTAIAQVELEDIEMDSTFNDIIFKVDGKQLIVATTRPEMLGACVAVFVNPTDERYAEFIGKFAKVPLYDHEVPILADEKADPEKGTGVVMCCTFGDQTDIEWWAEHDLPLRVVFEKNGTMNEVSGKYNGMKIRDARKQIIDDLKNENLLIRQKQIKHNVNVHERCKTDVEFLKTKQWFIRYLDLKEEFLELGNKINWYPKHMKVRYDHWIQGLRWDWCISRQRHFGVPFPVWYCEKCGNVKLAEEEQLPVDPLVDKPLSKCECGSTEFRPEKDVLDTWATSSLTPQLSIELMDKNAQGKVFPMDLRPQAHDIITFWLFNTVVKSKLHKESIPWKNVMISGFVLDPHRRKMSKSLGNIVEPQKVIEKFGADAMRFWAAGSKLGEDLPYQEKDLVTGQKLITKLWNACKFAFMHLKDFELEEVELEEFDKYMLAEMDKIVKICTVNFDKYEYSKTKSETEKFFWGMICDNYLEIVKDRLYNPDRRGADSRKSAQYTLYHMMLNTIKLMAPIMPFITEELYQAFFKKYDKCESVHVSAWPDFNEVDDSLKILGETVIYAVDMARKEKTSKNLSLKTPLKKLIVKSKLDKNEWKKVYNDVKAATGAEELSYEHIDKESKVDFDCEIGV